MHKQLSPGIVPREGDNNLQQAYYRAYELGAEALRGIDPDLVARHTSSLYDKVKKCFVVRYLASNYYVFREENRIEYAEDNGKNPSIVAKVLLVHYLCSAAGIPQTGMPDHGRDRWISFKELPNGGAIYCSNFQKRAVDPIVKRFSNDFDAFLAAAGILDGQQVNIGHIAVELPVFPQIPIKYVIWQGDDEVPSSGTILFEQSVVDFLPVEDVVVAASEGAYALIRAAAAAGAAGNK